MPPSLPILMIAIAAVVATGSVLSHKPIHSLMSSSVDKFSVSHATHASHGPVPAKQVSHSCGFIELVVDPEGCDVHPRKIAH